MKKRLFDIGRVASVICTSSCPSNYLSFKVMDEDGILYEVHGFPRIVADFGFLNLSIVSKDARAQFADMDGLFVCAYKPLLAFCAKHLKDKDIDSVCRLHEEVRLPPAFKADRMLKEIGLREPYGVEEGEPLRVDFSDPRLAKRVEERDITDPLSKDAMERAMIRG